MGTSKHNDSAVSVDDLMLVLDQVEGAETVKQMIFKSKEKLVLQHHKRNITLISKGVKAGRYKTYIGNPRKAIEAESYEGMVTKLYDYYVGKQTFSLSDGIEWEFNYRSTIKGTTQETISTLRFCIKRVLDDDMLNHNIQTVTDMELCDCIRSRIRERHLTYSDVKTTLQVLRGAFRQAMLRKIIRYDPIAGVQSSAFAKDCSLYRKKKTPLFSEDDIFQDDCDVLSPETIRLIQDHFWQFAEKEASARAILLNTYLGLRIGEDPGLLVIDIKEDVLHVHQSQIKHDHTASDPQSFEIVPWTKNERGVSKGGRYVPLDLNPEVRPLLELCKKTAKNGYLFTDENGIPVTKDSIRNFLERHMRMLQKETGLQLSKRNNHVFRKSLNSNVLIPCGFDEIERSMILGHSPRVNLENYTYLGSYKYKGIVEKAKSGVQNLQSLTGHSKLRKSCADEEGKIIVFSAKEKAPQARKIKA